MWLLTLCGEFFAEGMVFLIWMSASWVWKKTHQERKEERLREIHLNGGDIRQGYYYDKEGDCLWVKFPNYHDFQPTYENGSKCFRSCTIYPYKNEDMN